MVSGKPVSMRVVAEESLPQIARDPETPGDSLETLAGSDNHDVVRAVVANPSTPPHVLTKFAFGRDDSLRMEVARNPSTPQDVLMRMATDRDPTDNVPNAVAENPAITRDIALALAAKNERGTSRRLLSNPGVPADVIRSVYESNRDRAGLWVADNPAAPPEVLHDVYLNSGADGSARGTVRRSLADNPSTPPDVLRDLAADGVDGVAKNPNLPLDVLRAMLSDDDALLTFEQVAPERMRTRRYNAAQNPSLPADLMADIARESLINQGNMETAGKLLDNPALTDETRAILMHHSFVMRYGSHGADLRKRRSERITDLGVDPDNEQAVEQIGDRWWSMTPDDPEAALLRAMYPSK